MRPLLSTASDREMRLRISRTEDDVARILVLAIALAIATALPVWAAGGPEPTATNPRSMIKLHTEGRPGPPATLADVAWLEGRWIGEMPEGPVEHVILGPSFGHLPGFVRAVNPQGVIFYELWCLRRWKARSRIE